MSDFNVQVIEEFRANSGRVGGAFDGAPILLLHHVGARSGIERVVPLVYLQHGEEWAVFASKAGAPSHPAWYHNVKANPRTRIEVGDRTVEVVATEVTGAERDRMYATQAAAMPNFAEYEAQTSRVIPVILLSPQQ